ncbi:MAG: hypothetical protein M4D80_31160 [Myxococcota bacterium]|nr:hypothetical protein [Myxococcota bacterium]
MLKKLSIGALAVAALVLNPFYACSSDRAFTYSAAEMAAAIEGTWTLTASDRSYIFHIEQASEAKQKSSSRSLVPSAHACSQRTLVKSASACIDTSTMPVVVELSGQTTDGLFMVKGTRFESGHLIIEVAGQQVRAKVKPDGTAILVEGSEGTLSRSAR